ncbi:MAG: FAD binding domain-containing protein, partial [Thermoproteus sp.]
LALGGHISVRGLTSTRVVPVEEFFKGPYTTALGEDELVVEVSVPKRRGHAAYVKYARTAADFGIASVAVLLDVEGGVVKEARIGVSGVSLKPFRAKAIEEALAGRKPEEAALRRAVEVDPEVEPLSDARADANTRVKLFRAVAYRALREALAKAGVKAGP